MTHRHRTLVETCATEKALFGVMSSASTEWPTHKYVILCDIYWCHAQPEKEVYICSIMFSLSLYTFKLAAIHAMKMEEAHLLTHLWHTVLMHGLAHICSCQWF